MHQTHCRMGQSLSWWVFERAGKLVVQRRLESNDIGRAVRMRFGNVGSGCSGVRGVHPLDGGARFLVFGSHPIRPQVTIGAGNGRTDRCCVHRQGMGLRGNPTAPQPLPQLTFGGRHPDRGASPDMSPGIAAVAFEIDGSPYDES